MNEVRVSLAEFRKYMKFKYLVVSIFSIILFNSIFGLLNVYPSYTPIGSIYDTGDYGYSDAFSQFETRTNRGDITKIEYNPKELLVLINPRYDYQDEEIAHLTDLAAKGQPILIIGKGGFLETISRIAGPSLIFLDGRVVDYTNTEDGIFSVKTYYVEAVSDFNDPILGDQTFVTANAYSLFAANWKPLLRTTSTSSFADCVKEDEYCRDARDIAVIQDNVAIIADDLMLRNNNVRSFPQNLDLLPLLIEREFPDVQSIVFEESHLLWVAVSWVGLLLKINEIAVSPLIFILVFIISGMVPLFFGLKVGLFSSPADKQKGLMAKRLMKRFEIIHTDNMISVPLTKEEEILTNELINHKVYGRVYFTGVARDLLDYIFSHNIDEVIDEDILKDLKVMSGSYVSPNMAWKIIEHANFAIENAERERDQYFTRRN